MFKLVSSVAIGASLLALGACQTTSVSPSVISKIQAAGYQPIATSQLVAANNTGWTIYACPAEKCGRLSVIGFNNSQGNSNIFGETMETQLRKPGLSASKVKSDFARGLSTTYPAGAVSTVSVFQKSDHAGIIASGTGKTPQGGTFYFSGWMAARGNNASFVMGASETPTHARKAMNLGLQN